MKVLKFILLGLVFLCSCKDNKVVKTETTILKEQKKVEKSKVEILNIGTFHMGNTSDKYATDFDENQRKNIEEVHRIAEKIATFKPTVIVVERTPEQNTSLRDSFLKYKENPNTKFSSSSEIELLAFEVGRLSNTNRIYGIDHHLDYNYPLVDSLAHATNNKAYLSFMSKAVDRFKKGEKENVSVLEKLKEINSTDYLNFLIELNADNFTHIASENGFEGADEAAKFYKRNLRMFSNLNKISLDTNDRVLILLGATHTAYFTNFIKRNHKYEMVNTLDYLN